MRYTYTPSTNSDTCSKPTVGVGDDGVSMIALARNYQLSVKPRLCLGLIYSIRLCLIHNNAGGAY